jgi:hypothetical protein
MLIKKTPCWAARTNFLFGEIEWRVAVPKSKRGVLPKKVDLDPEDHRHFLEPMRVNTIGGKQVRFYDLKKSNARHFAFNTNRNHTVPTIQPTHAHLSKHVSNANPLNIDFKLKKPRISTIVCQDTPFSSPKLKPPDLPSVI